MICPNCSTENEPGRKFCGECGTRLAVACANCGTANAPGTRFCGECGSALDAPPVAGMGPVRRPFDPNLQPTGASTPGAAAGPVAERRLVTVLFADLVGFTSLSEGRDPEEVRELLSHYFDTAREQIERYGGTVEKFIGDAVMAVWGAPTAHEDDAERAVRAALEVVDAVKDLAPGLQARAGVLSGEAAVTVGARGQGMVAGDLVNTASRLQSAAQPGMVLVGETTQRATANSIAYEPAGEHELKGKATPVTAYRAIRVVAERGGRGRGDRLEAPFVGRDSELRLLKDLFHATARENRVRLVSITGQGGIGKSRLAWELKKYADGVAEDVWWHEGRSPAYGSGITFWALGEMVRARAEINETDDPATTRTKLGASVARFVHDPTERDRVERALQALLGVADSSGASAGELFVAWRMFFERMAGEGLLVMAFEDLHWADPGLLDFIDHMLEWSRNVPILIVTLARPELLERRPDWGAGRRNFLALDLEPLTEAAMRELLDGFVPGLSAAASRSIVARAEGIPLYAVETIRMLVADGRLRERDAGGFEPVGELGELAVPDTLHALIAARLDNLDPAERSLVQDAAVLGQSFTPAGLGAVSSLEPAALAARLRTLVKSDLLIEDIDPRSPERGQYAFVQALIREVAYSTLSLKDRRARHLAAARFFESIGDDELAGALASHYLAAFRATPAGEDSAALGTQARIALRAASDRAASLGSQGQAFAFLEQAIEITTDPADQADLLDQAVDALNNAVDARAIELAPRLLAIREQLADLSGQAEAVTKHAQALYLARQRELAAQIAGEAIERLASLGDHPALLRLEALHAQTTIILHRHDEGRALTDRALAKAERIGDADVAAQMLNARAQLAMFESRLWESLALAEGARRLAEQHGLSVMENRARATLTNAMALDDPRATAELEKEIVAYARAAGRRENEIVTLGNVAEDLRRTGEWEWILGELERAIRDQDRNVTDLLVENALVGMLLYRGEVSGESMNDLIERIGKLDDDAELAAAIPDLRGAEAFVGRDYATAARHWIEQAEASDLNAPYALPKAGLAAVLASDGPLARDILDRLTARGVRGRAIENDMALIRAGIKALDGDAADALAGYRACLAAYRELGLAWDEALLALLAGATLGAAEPEVLGWLADARRTFERLQAKPLVDALDSLAASKPLARAVAAPSRSEAQTEASSSST